MMEAINMKDFDGALDWLRYSDAGWVCQEATPPCRYAGSNAVHLAATNKMGGWPFAGQFYQELLRKARGDKGVHMRLMERAQDAQGSIVQARKQSKVKCNICCGHCSAGLRVFVFYILF